MPRHATQEESALTPVALSVYQGDDKRWLFRLKQTGGAPFPLIGYTANMHLRTDVADLVPTEVPVDTVVEIMDASAGEISVTLSSEQSTLLIESQYVWDLQIKDTTVTPPWTTTIASGTLTVTKEVTRVTP